MTASSLPLTVGGRPLGILQDGAGEPAEHSPRPFLHPVRTAGGVLVSGYRPDDHPWHWGLGLAVSTVAVVDQRHPVNLWGGPTFRASDGYVQLPNNGSQEVRGLRLEGSTVVQELDWRAADGSTFLTEERRWSTRTIQAGDTAWSTVEVRSRWVNGSGDVLSFGSPTTAGRPDAGYGGFFLRLAPAFDGADVVGPMTHGGAGTIPVDAAMGSRAAWLGLRSTEASVLMVCASGDTPWFVRATGTPMLCAAPFFHEEVHLGVGGSLEWHWLLLVADGQASAAGFADAAASARGER